MTTSTWLQQNNHHLNTALNWLYLTLSTHCAKQQQADLEIITDLEKQTQQTTETLHTAQAINPPPALLQLKQHLQLSPFELNVLLLGLSFELDPRIGLLCATAQGNPQQAYPTLALALNLFNNPAWDILSPRHPLLYWRLIELKQADTIALSVTPIRVDNRIVNYVKGSNYLDSRLTPLVTPFAQTDTPNALPPSQQATVENIIYQLQQFTNTPKKPIIQLLGADKESKALIATHTAQAINLYPYRLPAHLLPRQAANLETLTLLWQRECWLLPLILYVDAHDLDGPLASTELISAFNRFLNRTNTLIFLDTPELYSGLERPTIALDICKPTPPEQNKLWTKLVGETAPDSPAQLVSQFNLNLTTIETIATKTIKNPAQNGNNFSKQLWQNCLLHTRPRLESLAQRLELKATWSDIVMAADDMDVLRQISNQVKKRNQVYDHWGFRAKKNRGLGISVLFVGKSGTGKTMAAEVLANDLHLDLYRIDLASVVSKYIGETEKNLKQLFDAAEDGGAILFFDEADALFSKRSQVKDSHDRYANLEINYLLQRMEAYRGLAILASNRKANMDPAFVRRLRFIITFSTPSTLERKFIWLGVFPSNTPIEGLNYDHLAEYDLTGGSIYNVALNAAFLAAQQNQAVTMSIIEEAIEIEFAKTGRFLEKDLGWRK